MNQGEVMTLCHHLQFLKASLRPWKPLRMSVTFWSTRSCWEWYPLYSAEQGVIDVAVVIALCLFDIICHPTISEHSKRNAVVISFYFDLCHFQFLSSTPFMSSSLVRYFNHFITQNVPYNYRCAPPTFGSSVLTVFVMFLYTVESL